MLYTAGDMRAHGKACFEAGMQFEPFEPTTPPPPPPPDDAGRYTKAVREAFSKFGVNK